MAHPLPGLILSMSSVNSNSVKIRSYSKIVVTIHLCLVVSSPDNDGCLIG
ncbi:MAG: hypothetical protein ACMUHX_04785 [bacterium]